VGDTTAAADDVPGHLDPADAALFSLIAIAFTLVGALLTPGQVGIDERGAVLAAITGVLFAISLRRRRRREDD
jgi:membrane associated rhomboid family serine protease